MAKTASLGKKRAARKKSSRLWSLPFRVLGSTAGRFLVLGLAGVTLIILAWGYLEGTLYPNVRDSLLYNVGYGFAPMAAWLATFLAAARFKRGWLPRYWRWWAASALLILAAEAVLGGMYSAGSVFLADTLGGVLGQALWGGSTLAGAFRASALALAALVLLGPQAAKGITRNLLLSTGRALFALLRLGGGSIRRATLALGRKAKGLFIAFNKARAHRKARRQAHKERVPESWEYDEEQGALVWVSPEQGPSGGRPSRANPSSKPGVLQARGMKPAQGEEWSGVEEEGREGAATNGRARGRLPLFRRTPTGVRPTSLLHTLTGDHPPMRALEDDEDDLDDVLDTEMGALQEPVVRPWTLPPMPLLEYGPNVNITKDETSETAQKIEETLKSHGIEVEVNQIKPGPTVTLYGLTPGWVRTVKEVRERDDDGNLLRDPRGRTILRRKKEQTRVKVDAIVAREKDMALALAAPSLRIQAPVPGESVVGIEVPNRNPVLVSLRSVLESPQVKETTKKGGLALALGQGSGGDPVVTSLRKLPHLLIAGATGSGKSVCLNTIIISLITQISPEKLRLLLIDPKRVELTPFNGLPHLVKPVIVDTEDAVATLKGMLKEMFRRYRLLEATGVRNIDAYHAHPEPPEPMPYVVIAVDELADLMMSDRYNVERTLTRLAQLGRATGIHLVVATQRPSVDVVTGLIKANFPSRISFAVVSQVDSRTILDGAGAEKLLGKGDMLFLSTDTPKPQRVQGAYLSDREIQRVMDFWHNQHGPALPEINLELGPEEDERGDGSSSREDFADRGGSSGDDLLAKAIELAGRTSHISTSLLQRRLRIGYPRAARLMDQLEDAGILGPGGEPGKPREVYLPKQEGGRPDTGGTAEDNDRY
ncbi:MAG: DNA translocase FtsK [Chloroflexi bacterium]|nr:DNA translocase FtsK [Chloroflexota bacterium]